MGYKFYNVQEGVYNHRSIAGRLLAAGMAVMFAIALSISLSASAAHNGADISYATDQCGETTFVAKIADENGTHKVGNMRLVVHAAGVTQYTDVIPTDGSEVSLTVDPIYTQEASTQVVKWRVFGGAERGYDTPSWTGYNEPGFSASVGNYATEVGGYGWVLSDPDDPNPFTTWNEFEVESCAITKELCKSGAFAQLGFKNQGQCVASVVSNENSAVRNR